MHFDALDLFEELTKLVNNPYVSYDIPDAELKKALKNILERETESLCKETPLSEESIESFREELQKHAFEGKTSFSIRHIVLTDIINPKELTSLFNWCKENDIEVSSNIDENHESIYTFAWDN